MYIDQSHPLFNEYIKAKFDGSYKALKEFKDKYIAYETYKPKGAFTPIIYNGPHSTTIGMVDYAVYRGTKVIVHSKNYQNGSASVAEVQPDGTQGPTFWVDIADLNMLDYMHSWGAWVESVAPAKCECGSAKVPGLEGHHSSWCPAFKKDGL